MQAYCVQDAGRQLQDMQLDAAGMKRRLTELLNSQVLYHILCA